VIINDVELIFVAHEEHVDFLITRGEKTILLPLEHHHLSEIIGELAMKYNQINPRIKNAD